MNYTTRQRVYIQRRYFITLVAFDVAVAAVAVVQRNEDDALFVFFFCDELMTHGLRQLQCSLRSARVN